MDTTTVAIVAPAAVIVVIVILMTIRPSAAPGVSQVLTALSDVLGSLFPWTSKDRSQPVQPAEPTRPEMLRNR